MYLSKNIELRISKKYFNSYVYCSTSHKSQDVESTQMPVERWWWRKYTIYIKWNIIQQVYKEIL